MHTTGHRPEPKVHLTDLVRRVMLDASHSDVCRPSPRPDTAPPPRWGTCPGVRSRVRASRASRPRRPRRLRAGPRRTDAARGAAADPRGTQPGRRHQPGVWGRGQLRRLLRQRLHRAVQPWRDDGGSDRLVGAVRRCRRHNLDSDRAPRPDPAGAALPGPAGARCRGRDAPSRSRRHRLNERRVDPRQGRPRHDRLRPRVRRRLRHGDRCARLRGLWRRQRLRDRPDAKHHEQLGRPPQR